MKCPRCYTTEYEKGAKFCHVCGTMLQTDYNEASKGAEAIVPRCPACGASQPANARFCNNCGAAMSGNGVPKQSNSQNCSFALNQPTAVDLGLPSGTIWASCNVGAVKEEDYGGYYTLPEIEDIEKKGEWKLPSSDQILELINNCSFIWSKYNGCHGAKLVGPNGKILFLPAAGCRYEYGYEDVGSYGCYWRDNENQHKHPLSGCFGFDQQFNLYLCTGHSSEGCSARLIMKK